MGSGFSFAVLGPVRAWQDGSEIDLGSPQQRAVLAVLLLRAGAHVSAESLVDALWSEDPPRSAVGTIRTYIYRLRRLLGGEEIIRSAGNAYVLAAPWDALDVTRFRRSVDRAQQARADGDVALAARHLHEGLALWNGTPLAGIPGRFAETQRALLEELWLAATEDSVDSDLALGRHAEVIPGLTALTEENPYRERPRALLMLALYRAGRQAEALAVFDRVRRLFSEELGIEPGPQMRDLQLRILNADPELMDVPAAGQPPASAEPSAAAPTAADTRAGPAGDTRDSRGFHVPPAQLPRDLPTFAGRRADLDYVLAGFPAGAEHEKQPPASSVTVIAGLAGVGKTTLAVHAAHLLADRFPDGQLYLDLRGFDRSGMVQSPQDAVRQLLAGLGVPPDRVPGEPDAQIGLYRSVLAGRRVLIVLDNARSAEQVRPLLPGARDCQVLVTSRDQMRSLIAIEGARLVGLSPLSPDDAREALIRRLGADRVAAEPEAVDTIVRLCAGLPLTLSIVAARAATRPTHPLSSIAAELTRSGTGLQALADPDSATDARASLALSYHALSAGAARILRLSSLHPGAEASRDALASLAGIDAAEAEGDLDELERGYLMTQPEPFTYACHDLVRAYAAELAATEDAADEDDVRLRMLDHYRQNAYRAMLTLRSNRSPVAFPNPLPGVTVKEFSSAEEASGWFASLYPVLRVLLEQTIEHNLPEYTWQLAWTLDTFHDRQGRWQDKSWVHRAGLVAAEKLGNLTWQAHSHRSLGSAFRLLGDYQRAMEHFQVAQRLYTELGQVAEQAMNLHNLVAVYQSLGLQAEALTHARLALELSEEIDDRQRQAIALNNLGWMYSNDGDQAAAIDCAQRALVLLDDADEVNLRAQLTRTLGQCQYRAGYIELAMPNLMAALGIFHDQQDRYEEAYTLRWIAIAQRAAGHDAPARRAWQGALPILSDLGDDLPAFESFAAEDASTRR